MCEYSVQPAKHVDKVFHPNVLAVRIVHDDKSAREDLLISHDVGGPVQGVAAVVNRTTALRLLVNGAEKLPLGGTHLGASASATGWCVEQETNDERVALGNQEAAELVKPEGTVDAGGRLSQLQGGRTSKRLGVGGGMIAVEGREVLLQLEGRVQL